MISFTGSKSKAPIRSSSIKAARSTSSAGQNSTSITPSVPMVEVKRAYVERARSHEGQARS
nr:MAG TPA: hypothetical protein [Caudoviricetes sp.]